jgi:hypothetical protein
VKEEWNDGMLEKLGIQKTIDRRQKKDVICETSGKGVKSGKSEGDFFAL